jgi:hypothetical protein
MENRLDQDYSKEAMLGRSPITLFYLLNGGYFLNVAGTLDHDSIP